MTQLAKIGDFLPMKMSQASRYDAHLRPQDGVISSIAKEVGQVCSEIRQAFKAPAGATANQRGRHVLATSVSTLAGVTIGVSVAAIGSLLIVGAGACMAVAGTFEQSSRNDHGVVRTAFTAVLAAFAGALVALPGVVLFGAHAGARGDV